MRRTAFYNTSISYKRILFGRRSKRRRFPIKIKCKKKLPKFLSRCRRRRLYMKNNIKREDESEAKDNAQDQSPNINGLIYNMSQLQV